MVSLSSSDSLPDAGPGSFFSAVILLCPEIRVQPRSCGGRDLRAEVLLIASLGLFLLLLWWGRRGDLLGNMLGDEMPEQRMSQVWAIVKRTAYSLG